MLFRDKGTFLLLLVTSTDLAKSIQPQLGNPFTRGACKRRVQRCHSRTFFRALWVRVLITNVVQLCFMSYAPGPDWNFSFFSLCLFFFFLSVLMLFLTLGWWLSRVLGNHGICSLIASSKVFPRFYQYILTVPVNFIFHVSLVFPFLWLLPRNT